MMSNWQVFCWPNQFSDILPSSQTFSFSKLMLGCRNKGRKIIGEKLKIRNTRKEILVFGIF